jgi:hypothetical protein
MAGKETGEQIYNRVFRFSVPRDGAVGWDTELQAGLIRDGVIGIIYCHNPSGLLWLWSRPNF